MEKQWRNKSKKINRFIFLGSKITADGDCSHEVKGHLLFGRKVMTNLDSIFQRRRWHPTLYSCLENPMDGGAWWATVHGVAKSQTRLTSLSLFTFMHWRRKWRPTPVFLRGESQGWWAWWAAVYGVTQSQTQLKRLSSSSREHI